MGDKEYQSLYEMLRDLRVDMKNMRDEMREEHREMREEHLKPMAEQVKRTNGRVTNLELWRSMLLGGVGVATAIPLLGQIVRILSK